MQSEHERDELLEVREELRKLRREVDEIRSALARRAQQRASKRLARAGRRMRWWVTPKIGKLRHHPPETLTVPRSYARTTPPDPSPSVTIVTPSFRQARFLGRTLRSVLDQGYPALEYVVQDGGSEDGTVEVIRAHEGSLARWESAPDGGQANAINLGFAGTSGEIMAYLNSDDILLPGALAYASRYLASHPDVDAVYGQRVLINERGEKIGVWVTPPHDEHTLQLVDFVPQETLFWRRRLWERCGGYVDERLEYAIDWELLLRFQRERARIVRLPRFMGGFRVHEEQKTTTDLAVGLEESERLRERVLGEAIGHEQAEQEVRPYLRRHLVHHAAHRAAVRLPLPRIEVEAAPLEG